MGVPQSKHSYVYKPKKRLRKKTLHNSVFVEKPEYLIYDDVMHGTDDNTKYNTTKSCIDIRAIQKRKDQSRPLSLDEDMLERPTNNISNFLNQYRQDVASEIAKIVPPVGDTTSSRSQGSSDGFKDVYDDDYYENQMESGQFQDAMSYHSLEFDTTRHTEVDGPKLNKSVEFEFERVGSRKLSRKSSGRRVKVDKPSEASTFTEDNNKPDIHSRSEPEVSSSSKTDLSVLELTQPAPAETVHQLSSESTLEEPTTPQEIITLEEVNSILQNIKDKILHGEMNDTEVYHQLLMCKKKAQGIHVSSIKIRAKKTMLIGKINKFLHWFAISEPNAQEGWKENKEIEHLASTDKDASAPESRISSFEEVETTRTASNNHYENLSDTDNVETKRENTAKLDARTILIVNTMKDQQQTIPDAIDKTDSTKQINNSDTPSSNCYITQGIESCSNDTSAKDLQFYENRAQLLESKTYENDPPFVEITNPFLQNTIIGTSANVQENELDDMIVEPLNVYEEISNIRLLLEEVHGRMDAFTGGRYDLEYCNIIDQVAQAKTMLHNVRDTQLLEDAIIKDYEKFFEDLLLYFEELIERNETAYDNVFHDNEEQVEPTHSVHKTVRFERQSSLNESEYYINGNNQLSFDYKSETSTNLSDSEDESGTQFLSLTEYDGKVIQACETFNKAIELQGDDGSLSPDDEFMYKTNAAGQIVFEHEENPKPYIVDPISFSKCRMRPLSIIQEQLDEFMDCHQEKLLVQDEGNEDGHESEDREDWDSFDEHMAKNTKMSMAPAHHEASEAPVDDESDETREFEELERNIDSLRTSIPDLLVNDKCIDETSTNSEDSDREQNNVDYDEPIYENTAEIFPKTQNTHFELTEIDDHAQTEVQKNQNFEELPSEPYEPVTDDCSTSTNDYFIDQNAVNKDFDENPDHNGFYSLESMSSGQADMQENNSGGKSEYKIYPKENMPETRVTETPDHDEEEEREEESGEEQSEEHFKDPHDQELLTQPTNKSSSEHCDSADEDIKKILDISNYNFNSKELSSYNEIVEINSSIDDLQFEIDAFTGTKTSPQYMLTYRKIFDKMRILNNIDNCNYQEDILNMIDYTSDKIQKCIFELGLKVS